MSLHTRVRTIFHCVFSLSVCCVLLLYYTTVCLRFSHHRCMRKLEVVQVMYVPDFNKPEIFRVGRVFLTRETSFVARHLEIVAVAELLWFG